MRLVEVLTLLPGREVTVELLLLGRAVLPELGLSLTVGLLVTVGLSLTVGLLPTVGLPVEEDLTEAPVLAPVVAPGRRMLPVVPCGLRVMAPVVLLRWTLAT